MGNVVNDLHHEARKTEETERPSTAEDGVEQVFGQCSSGEKAVTGNNVENTPSSPYDEDRTEKVMMAMETNMRPRRWRQPGASPLRVTDAGWVVSVSEMSTSAEEEKTEVIKRKVNRILRDRLGPVDRDDMHKGLMAARLGIWWDRALKIWGDGEDTEAPPEVFSIEPRLPENGYIDTDFRDYKPMGNGTLAGRGTRRVKLEAPASRYRYTLEDEELGDLLFDGKAFHPDAWAFLIRDGGEGLIDFGSRGTCVRYRTRVSGSDDVSVVYTDERAAAAWRASRDALDKMLNEEETRGKKMDANMKMDAGGVSSRNK
ncbi:hypothetical protein C8Q79DRAFT_460601 [Trametes meyenii]|nr:hypothetical protein C8Q79DRAFT_460601 [Trametes meyenii]